jgi:hypothetical protein
MLKVTSFSALIAGLLIAIPMVFTDAEASHPDNGIVAAKADRELVDTRAGNRMTEAFQLLDVCSQTVTGDAASWCAARHAEMSDAGTKLGDMASTVETRDEATQTSTLAATPAVR